MARKHKFILQRMENVKKGREAFVNGKRRKIKGKENIPMRRYEISISLSPSILIAAFSFANRSARFMDAYDKGLNGEQAAWAARKYRGHRVLPENLMDDFEEADLN